jgi:hypothetical protein
MAEEAFTAREGVIDQRGGGPSPEVTVRPWSARCFSSLRSSRTFLFIA